MSHDSYEHERRQTVALERIAELLEGWARPITLAITTDSPPTDDDTDAFRRGFTDGAK